MNLKNIGESGLIKQIKKSVKTSSSVIKGIGDDCAVVAFSKTKYMLLTCDMLIENVDFKINDSPFWIGHKSLACSISDIASMGGLPKYALVSLGLPEDLSAAFLRQLYRGINRLAGKFHIDIVGGDISKAGRLTIDISMVGFVEKIYLTLRSNAKVNDIIFITGELGAAPFGRHLTFMPRLKEARYLVENYKINAMIDISDGLLKDLSHILEESSRGASIYQWLVPLYRKQDNFLKVVSRGEDFELLFTSSAKEAGRLIASGKRIYTAIGQILPKDYGLRLINGRFKEDKVKPLGFLHF